MDADTMKKTATPRHVTITDLLDEISNAGSGDDRIFLLAPIPDLPSDILMGIEITARDLWGSLAWAHHTRIAYHHNGGWKYGSLEDMLDDRLF